MTRPLAHYFFGATSRRKSFLCRSVLFLAASVLALAAQPYGLENRPAVGPFLNGVLPASSAAPFPALLSQTGAFADVASLTAAPGLIPFEVNAALWTDGAVKRRWIAVPTNAQIAFASTGLWTFPPGTVLVKHFELGVNETNPAIRWRVETRLLIMSSNNTAFGATYRWRTNQIEADLLAAGLSENIVIQTAVGTRKQRWSYPSREDCLMCHNYRAGFVLGPRTAQLNRDAAYDVTGITDNQLRAWSHIGLFANPPAEEAMAALPKMSGLGDESASLEARARSYLDVNCAHCHQPGGPAHAFFDARHVTPLEQQGMINGRVAQDLNVLGARLLAPGDADRSTVLLRQTIVDSLKMPPLGRNTVDTGAAQLMREWIDSLPRAGGPYRLVAAGEEWKYLDDGAPPDPAWNQPGFDDRAWLTGNAEFGFGDFDEVTTINSGLPGAGLITAYFRREFTLSDAPLHTNLLVRLLRDDGAIVYLNGAEVLRSNLPNGPVNHGALALTDIDGDAETEFIEAAVAPSLLREGTNVIAVEVHQHSALSDDVSFDLVLLGYMRAAARNIPPGMEVPPPVGGPFLLRIYGFDDQLYRIEASTNLIDWLPRWTNAPTRGVLEFTEPDGAAPFRFYRARIWP
jgi:uncharacterized repeat protein (TIGR03806 family)